MFVDTIQTYLEELRMFTELAILEEDKGVTEQKQKPAEVLKKLMSNPSPGTLRKLSSIIEFYPQETRTLSL